MSKSHRPQPLAEPCPLCGRPLIKGPSVNQHHLIPRRYRGTIAVEIHRICHDKIHAVLTEADLRDHYHTFARLREHPELDRFIRWVARKPPDFVDGHHEPGPGRRNRRRSRLD